MRIDSTGVTIKSGFTLNSPQNLTTTSLITITGGGLSFTCTITYTLNINKVSLQIGSSGIRTFSSAASFLNAQIPAGLAPPTSGMQPMWIFPISVNGTYTPCTVFLNPMANRFEIYPNVSMATGWASGNNVQWTGFVLEYFTV
jgi:hypothetical protein